MLISSTAQPHGGSRRQRRRRRQVSKLLTVLLPELLEACADACLATALSAGPGEKTKMLFAAACKETHALMGAAMARCIAPIKGLPTTGIRSPGHLVKLVGTALPSTPRQLVITWLKSPHARIRLAAIHAYASLRPGGDSTACIRLQESEIQEFRTLATSDAQKCVREAARRFLTRADWEAGQV